MRVLNKKFENRLIDYDKLVKYGFIKNDDNYIFETNIVDNNFKVIVYISKKEQYSKVIDLSIMEEYIPVDIENSVGDFIGKIKDEYESILNDIIDNCTTLNVFKSEQSKEIIKYIKSKYGADLEYLWEKFSNNAVCRNKENNKWYILFVVLEESKLGIDSNNVVDIIDLRYQKDKITDIIDNKNIFKGYHMNKNSWITIKLDGSLNLNYIFELIDNSYDLSLKK